MPDRVKYLSLTFRKTKTNHEIYFFISGANQNGVDPHNQMHPGQMGQDPMAQKQNQMQQPNQMQNQQQNQQQMNQQHQQPPPPQQQQPPMQQ